MIFNIFFSPQDNMSVMQSSTTMGTVYSWLKLTFNFFLNLILSGRGLCGGGDFKILDVASHMYLRFMPDYV